VAFSWKSPEPLALSVPLSRFTSRVGGGSAFYVDMAASHAMSIFTKRRLGLLLICISVVALVICLIVVPHRVFADSSGPGGPIFGGGSWELGWQYTIPIIVCGAVGVFCLAQSSRKPPKLPK
jgi:hypothetical protein